MNEAVLNKIQKNLSFSYLHAVTSCVGGSCEGTGQDADGEGIDARLTFAGKFSKKPICNLIDINVQLKSTRKKLTIANGKISFSLSADQYTKYTRKSTTHFLFVLFHVPDDPQQWLSLSVDELILRKCSYWTGLKGAPPCDGKNTTIYIPANNILSVEQMQTILKGLSEGKELKYGS